MLPTNTMNITGLRSCRFGLSLRNESTTARLSMGGSNSGRAFVLVVISNWLRKQVGSCRRPVSPKPADSEFAAADSPTLRTDHLQMLHDRAEREGGHEREGAHQDHRAYEHHDEQR